MRMELRERRLSKKLTQKYIAECVGISERAYRFIETNKKTPSVDTAQRIAQTLDSTVEKLFPLPQRQLREQQSEPDGNQT